MKTETENLDIPIMEGLSRTREAARQIKGQLQPPPQFDAKKLAGKWVKSGPAVQQAKQSQFLEGGYKVAGWEVWKHKGKPVKRALSNGVYVLMFRPRKLQEAVAAINGNASRAKIIRQHKGETLHPHDAKEGIDAPPDSGMLLPPVLDLLENPAALSRRQVPVSAEDEQLLKFNQIKPLDEAAAARATTKPKKSTKR